MNPIEETESAELATVHHLPTVDGGAVEGEFITEEEYQRLTSEKARMMARYQGYKSDVVTVARVTKTVATHDKTKTAAKALVRNAIYVGGGAKVLAVRAWESSTNARYERLMRGAELRGDMDALKEWDERAEAAKERRHSRRMDMLTAPGKVAKALAISVAAGIGFLLALGIVLAVSNERLSDVIAPIKTVIDAINWIVMALTIAWGPIVLAAPWVAVIGLWHLGRKAGAAPGWLQTSAESDVDVSIDETTIAAALSALRIPQVTAYLKTGSPLQFLTPARVDGRGTHAVVRLPAGVTAEKVARRRGDLATGLHRLAKEVWPTTGSEAGILDLWVADKGALAEGAGEYPLLTDGVVDVFKGVPFGKTLRGNPMNAPLMERNTICGGMPGQGKSSAARIVMAGAALDPTAELRIWVPDANFDFEVFKPRCTRYVMGAEDERIAEILADLQDLHAEVQRRGELLVKYEIPAVTREYASKNVGLHPIFALLEEAHVAIQHPLYGKEISKLLVDIVRLGRKRGIHLIVSTQAPTKDSMPRDVTRNCSNGVAFAVGDHVANDALLGQGAYAAGHRATELIPGTDKGTAVVKGFTGERSEIVQVYFLDVSKENDQVTPIIERALAAMKSLPGTPATAREIPAARDLLEDLDAALGDTTVNAADVPALLAAHAPGWEPYKRLTGKGLREILAAQYGVKVPSTGNRWPVDPVTVREALAKQATADLDGDE